MQTVGIAVDGALPPSGERGDPEERSSAIVANIIYLPPEGGPHSGQNPGTQIYTTNLRGKRRREG